MSPVEKNIRKQVAEFKKGRKQEAPSSRRNEVLAAFRAAKRKGK